MLKIDLVKIIESNQLDFNKISDLLFPMHKYPDLALRRVLKGDSLLDANQISRLATYLDVSVNDLFTVGGWKSQIEDGFIYFESGQYEAFFNRDNWTCQVFHKKKLLHERVIVNPAISLKEFISYIQTIIENEN
jgi:hypothetical protein